METITSNKELEISLTNEWERLITVNNPISWSEFLEGKKIGAERKKDFELSASIQSLINQYNDL